jgi:hypothetical protein
MNTTGEHTMNRVIKRASAIGLGLWAGVASAVPTQWTVEAGGNGHWYELSDYRLNWEQARADAASRSHQGLPGYLATVTSLPEATFVNDLGNSSGNRTGWLAGSDAEVEGDWRWTDGPEAGQLFWRGGSDGTATGYAGWGVGWPNTEDYLANIYGSWGSYPLGQGDFFYVEFSTPVPEPAAWLLLVAGLAVIARQRARGDTVLFTEETA